MRPLTFIRFYALSAALGACGLWVVACASNSIGTVGPNRSGVIREREAVGTRLSDLGGQDPPSRLRNEQPTPGESLAAKAGSPGYASESPFTANPLTEAVPGRSEVAVSMAPTVARSRGVRHVPGPRASTLLERDRAGAYHPYIVTGYSHGCVLPKFGPEPPPQRMANGEWPVAGLHVAADPSIAFGTVLEVVYRGLPSRLIVGDRGRAIRGRRLDLFLADCDRARAWGRRTAYVREIGE